MKWYIPELTRISQNSIDLEHLFLYLVTTCRSSLKKCLGKSSTDLLFYLYFYFLVFLGPHWWHMEVPRLGVESELQKLTYTTATALRDPSHICDLHHSSLQCLTLNPLSEARDQTHLLMDILVRFITAEP